jgi:hypothetical protein
MLTDFAHVACHEPNQLDPNNTTITQLIILKVHVAYDHEHNYHDSLHSTEVVQLYSQVGDLIAT